MLEARGFRPNFFGKEEFGEDFIVKEIPPLCEVCGKLTWIRHRGKRFITFHCRRRHDIYTVKIPKDAILTFYRGEPTP